MVCPLVSTVVASSEDGFMDKALDRTKYCGTETPQAFRRDMITAAYSKVRNIINDVFTKINMITMTNTNEGKSHTTYCGKISMEIHFFV